MSFLRKRLRHSQMRESRYHHHVFSQNLFYRPYKQGTCLGRNFNWSTIGWATFRSKGHMESGWIDIGKQFRILCRKATYIFLVKVLEFLQIWRQSDSIILRGRCGNLFVWTNASSVSPNGMGGNNSYCCTVIGQWWNRPLALRRSVGTLSDKYLLRPSPSIKQWN